MFRNFVFEKILYPVFRKQFNRFIEEKRLGQVLKSENLNGEVRVTVNKIFKKNVSVTIYAVGKTAHDPEFKDHILCNLEDVYAYGRVVEVHEDLNQCVVLLTYIKLPVPVGALVKHM